MTESNVVRLPRAKRVPREKNDSDLAADIRKRLKALCRAIDAATAVGLAVELTLDAADTYGGYGDRRVRCREPRITRTVT